MGFNIECDRCGKKQHFDCGDQKFVRTEATCAGWHLGKVDLCAECLETWGPDGAEKDIMEQNIRMKADADSMKSIERGSMTTLEIELTKVVVEAPGGARSLVRVQGMSIRGDKVLVTVQK